MYALHLTEPGKSQVLLEQKGSVSGLILVIHLIINALLLFLVYGVIEGQIHIMQNSYQLRQVQQKQVIRINETEMITKDFSF